MSVPKNSKFTIALIVILFSNVTTYEDAKFWHDSAEKDLKESLSNKWNLNTAKNVVLFVGDGMSPDTITASRIYQGGERNYLSWERFPHVGLLKTYNTNKQVPDSASTATALFSGVKTNYQVAGVDASVRLGDCESSLDSARRLESIFDWAHSVGKNTGFVTTTRVTHATPSALYAHTADRRWECENKMPKSAKNCKDIARQLIEDEPGKSIKVIMGGGRQVLQSNATARKNDPIDEWACRSSDGRNLIERWKSDKLSLNIPSEVVGNNEELSRVDFERTESLLGIFSNGHLPMDYAREKGPKGQPSLEDMTVAAIKILQKSESGYLLVVEGGLIDFAHHRGHAAQALQETVRLSEAVNATLALVDLEETLVIVTSDHTHSMSINGYSDRGNSILGIAQKSKHDGLPFTTLSYSTGGPNNMAYTVVGNKSVRINVSLHDTTSFTYSQQAAIITDEAYHGGGDVAVYAIGPFGHLFHSTHEQNYVAHAIAYASKIGPHMRNTGSISQEYFPSLLGTIVLLISSIYTISDKWDFLTAVFPTDRPGPDL